MTERLTEEREHEAVNRRRMDGWDGTVIKEELRKSKETRNTEGSERKGREGKGKEEGRKVNKWVTN